MTSNGNKNVSRDEDSHVQDSRAGDLDLVDARKLRFFWNQRKSATGQVGF